MKPFGRTLKVIALAIGVLTMSACTALDTSLAGALPAAKLDNGLGDLPHYRDWIDPSGRTPTEPMLTARDSTR